MNRERRRGFRCRILAYVQDLRQVRYNGLLRNDRRFVRDHSGRQHATRRLVGCGSGGLIDAANGIHPVRQVLHLIVHAMEGRVLERHRRVGGALLDRISQVLHAGHGFGSERRRACQLVIGRTRGRRVRVELVHEIQFERGVNALDRDGVARGSRRLRGVADMGECAQEIGAEIIRHHGTGRCPLGNWITT